MIGPYKGMQFKAGIGKQNTLESIRPELRIPALPSDSQAALHRARVPANQFTFPTAAEEVVAIGTEYDFCGLGFVRTECARSTILRIHQVDNSALIGHR